MHITCDSITLLPPSSSIVRDAMYSSSNSDTCVKLVLGSHVTSWSGYPSHFTRYSFCLRCWRWSRMRLTLYLGTSLMVTGGGGGSSGGRSAIWEGFWYCRRREMWKTGCTLRVSGRSSLYVTVMICYMCRSAHFPFSLFNFIQCSTHKLGRANLICCHLDRTLCTTFWLNFVCHHLTTLTLYRDSIRT